MDSPRRRSRLPLQQGEDSLEVELQAEQQPEKKSELPPGARFSPYPSGEGGMIIEDGFVR